MAIARWESLLYVCLVSLVILAVTLITLLALQLSFPSTLHVPTHVILSTLSLLTYFLTHLTAPGNASNWTTERPDLLHPQASPHARSIPPEPKSVSDSTDEEAPLQSEARWCNRCAAAKPTRVHHCSACDACVLRFDHHCPWVGNCIGLLNAKYFVLFLFYTTLCAAHSSLILARSFAKTRLSRTVLRGWKLATAILTPVALAASITAFVGVGAILCWNLWLLGRNETALENLRLQDGKGGMDYSAGVIANTRHVLGWNPGFWLLPVRQRRGPREKCKV